MQRKCIHFCHYKSEMYICVEKLTSRYAADDEVKKRREDFSRKRLEWNKKKHHRLNFRIQDSPGCV